VTSSDTEGSDSPLTRLNACLEAVPVPLSTNTDVEKTAKRLSRDTEALSEAGPRITVHVLSSYLSDYLVNHLILMFARRGMAAEIRQGEYGVIAAAILDESHQIHIDPPDLFLILPSFRDLSRCPPVGASTDDVQVSVDQEAGFWQSLWARLPAPAVQLLFDTPNVRVLGEMDGLVPGGLTHHARHVNMALANHVPNAVALVDSEALALSVGLKDWHDPHVYSLCKQPFSFAALPHVADALSAAATGLLGRARKVLVLDLDDTLWGGIVGDDGLDNLDLGLETPEGEAFTTFQQYILQLRGRGVILAVCSKNQEDTARIPFKDHPAMVLKESDIACFIANFDDKPSNIRRIAESLNVGLDALVFVDDNPVERALMRRELPQVLNIELPENPALYASALDASRAFPLSQLTSDDLSRADSYTSRAATIQAMGEATDLDGFLADLEAHAVIEPLGAASVNRVAQLLAKTNQFKLNPQVFSGPELEARARDVIALRLTDRLQDYGIVAVAVLESNPDPGGVLMIENWVMSCRVFSRRLEFVMMEEILRHAIKVGAEILGLTYTPSDRNGLIADLLPKLGFALSSENDMWSAPVLHTGREDYPAHHIDIVRSDS
jgi:FkbH-like protein